MKIHKRERETNIYKTEIMKSWISSAFDVEAGSTSRVSSSSRSSTQPKKQPPTQTQQTELRRAYNKENIPSSSLIKQTVRDNGAKKNEPEVQTLCEKYEPRSRADLVVNKNKVDQLSQILDDLTNRKKGAIVLVEGPSGCGKTVNLKLLVSEMSQI